MRCAGSLAHGAAPPAITAIACARSPATTTPAPAHAAAVDGVSVRRGQHASTERLSQFSRRASGLVLASLAIAAVAVRQLSGNAAVPAPSSTGEATVGVNAFAELQAQILHIETSLPDTFASWQLAGYSYLTSAGPRHDSLVGPTREMVLVASVLTAAFIVGACRRMHVGWFSTALVIALSGLPSAVALLRIESPPAALATCWISLGVLTGIAAAGGTRLRWVWLGLSIGATVLGILTARFAILVPLGMLLGALVSGLLTAALRPTVRTLVVAALGCAVVGAFWVTVWEPAVPGGTFRRWASRVWWCRWAAS